MPKLSAVIDSLDAVAEPLRDLYAKRDDGKFQLDADVEGHTAVRGLKSAHEAQKEETRRAKEAAKQYEGLGLTAEDIKALVDEKKAREEKKLKDEGDFASLKQQLLDSHTKALGEKDGRITKLGGAINKLVAENAATLEITKQNGRPTLLLPHVMKALKVVEDEATGEFAAVVVDAKGNTRVNAKGDPLTIADYVAELKAHDDYAGAFSGSGASGSGAGGSGSAPSGSGAVRTKADLKTDAAKAKFVADHGRQAYIDLPAK